MPKLDQTLKAWNMSWVDTGLENMNENGELFSELSRTVPGSILGGVTGDFFRGTPDRTMCPEVDSATESEYQGFLLE